MTTIHSLLVYTHILFGAAALVLFWVPVVARKGSPLHRHAGRYYATSMYVVSVSAFVACLLVLADPIGMREPDLDVAGAKAAELAWQFRMGALFLLMLSILVFTSVRHGLLALRERNEAGILRTPLHRGMIIALGALGVGIGSLGIAQGLILLMIFGGVALISAVGMFRDTLPERLTQSERTIAHLGGLIGSGIGAYTAFFAFGGARFLGDLLPGQWQALSWIVAPVVGTLAIRILNRRYRPARATSRQAG